MTIYFPLLLLPSLSGTKLFLRFCLTVEVVCILLVELSEASTEFGEFFSINATFISEKISYKSKVYDKHHFSCYCDKIGILLFISSIYTALTSSIPTYLNNSIRWMCISEYCPYKNISTEFFVTNDFAAS